MVGGRHRELRRQASRGAAAISNHTTFTPPAGFRGEKPPDRPRSREDDAVSHRYIPEQNLRTVFADME